MKEQLYNYPEYAEVNGIKYKINTDFRVAIKCNDVSLKQDIDDLEKCLAIIYLLFGNKGLDDCKNNNELIIALCEKAKTYLQCGKDIDNLDPNEKPDMDFVEDYAYIKTSFLSDYGVKLDEEHYHWWEFMDLMNGLSNSELGNCCVLNRIRNLRTYDTRNIKDSKERRKIEEAKKQVALKRYKKEKTKATDEQLQSADAFLKELGLGKE